MMMRPASLDEKTIHIANISTEFTSLNGWKRSLEFLTLELTLRNVRNKNSMSIFLGKCQ